MEIVAIIPARGGSRGVPRKNIKLLAGKPLIAYTITAALGSKYINRIIVSTDDKEIAKIAKHYGAEVPFIRPKKFARHTSSSLSVILHALYYLEKHEEYFPDIILFLPPTSPFRETKYIDEGIEKIKTCDAVVGVSEIKNHPYFAMKKKSKFLEPFVKIKNRPLARQDLPKLYYINTSLFIAKREYYNRAKEPDPVAPMFSRKVKGVFMDDMSSIDLDSQIDFFLAEAILRYKKIRRNKIWKM